VSVLLSAGYLDRMATVYTPDPTTGAFTAVARRQLPVRVAGYRTTAAAPDRQRLAQERVLVWDGAYAMPSPVQIEVTDPRSGARERWAVVPGTGTVARGFGQDAYAKADVVRVA